MKPFLITGAMDIETDLLFDALTQAVSVPLGCWKCKTGLLDGYPTAIVRTNQGMANAAAATALAIEKFSPCAVLNQGTSGGHAPHLHTGDLVIGEKVINLGALCTPERPRGAGFDPFSAQPLGLEIANPHAGDGEKMTVFAGDAALIAAAKQVSGYPVHLGVIGSGDLWHNEWDRIDWLHKNRGTWAEEMEAAASAQICMAYKIPFLTIRILSNTAVHGEPFTPETGSTCQMFVREVVRQYTTQQTGKATAKGGI